MKSEWKTPVGLFIVVFLFALVMTFAPGCAPKNATFEQHEQHAIAMMDHLREARFKGHVRFAEGGSFLGVHFRESAWLGPSDSTLDFAGDVDFTVPPRAVDATAIKMGMTPKLLLECNGAAPPCGNLETSVCVNGIWEWQGRSPPQ